MIVTSSSFIAGHHGPRHEDDEANSCANHGPYYHRDPSKALRLIHREIEYPNTHHGGRNDRRNRPIGGLSLEIQSYEVLETGEYAFGTSIYGV